MSDVRSSTRRRWFALSALLLSITGLVLAPIYIVSATQSSSSHSSQILQQKLPTVGVGAGYMRFEHLGIQNGLSDNTVLAVLQDSLGFMWFGTREGLNKYDGYEFVTYKAGPNTPGALSDSYITSLAETPDGALWVGTYDGGLNRFDPKTQTFEQVRLDSDAARVPNWQVNTLEVDSQGRLWVGTQRGLFRLDPDDRKVFRLQHDPNDEFSLSADEVQSLFADGEGNLWVGSANGLNLLARDGNFTRYLTDVRLEISEITSITSGEEGSLWIGSQGGLILFDPEESTYQVFRHNPNDPQSLLSNHVSALFKDRSGQLWIGFEDQGIGLVWDPGRWGK